LIPTKEIAKSNLKILEMRSILLPHKVVKGIDKVMAAAQMQANMQKRKQTPFEDNGFKDAGVVLPPGSVAKQSVPAALLVHASLSHLASRCLGLGTHLHCNYQSK
jgi:hypothetical protein